jgi:DNA-binding LacI/PurR family transcriptional regulator
MAGMLKEAQKSSMRIQGVPVSSVNNPQKIDWDELEDFNSETTVIVSGFWFKEVFPFLYERKCKVIFCDFHTGDDAKAYPAFFRNWTILRLDAQKAMVKTVDLLAKKNFKRIGYVYNVYFQDSPLMAGFRDGMSRNNLPWTEDNLIYSGNIDNYYDRIQTASDNFDVLILSAPDLVRQTMMILRSSGQKVPGDIALICFGDKQNFVNLEPPLSALSIPFYRIGQTIAGRLQYGELDNTEFETEIFVRESLKAGAGRNINAACIMDNQEEVNKADQFNFFVS